MTPTCSSEAIRPSRCDAHQVCIDLAVGQPGDLVTGEHELADLAHEGVKDVDLDTDR